MNGFWRNPAAAPPDLPMPRDLVVVTWNGQGDNPFPFIDFDADPAFEIACLCYMGTPAIVPAGVRLFKHRTQCKGECFTALIAELERDGGDYGYVGLIDDDIEIAVSGINAMLREARAHAYGSFAASLTADSHAAHPRFRSRPGQDRREIGWVEVMAPFLRWDLLRASAPLIAGNTSSYGFDQFVMTMLQKVMNLPGAVLFDSVTMRHARPITSDSTVFANGLTAHRERVLQRRRAIAWLAAVRPDLVATRWWFGWVAPWNGPVRFLGPRLWQPFAPIVRRWRRYWGGDSGNPPRE